MDGLALLPWMLQADWREDARPFVIVDLATWPTEQPIAPLPPVPVIATGSADHPQAGAADILVEPPVSLDRLAPQIIATPRAAAVLVQLLRATEGLAPEHALSLESIAFAMLQAGAEHRAWLARQPQRDPLPAGTLHLSRTGGRLDLLIDRPAARNAIDRGMRDALHDAFVLAALDLDIATVRLRGVGPCFSVGADLAEFGTTSDPVEAHTIRSRTLPALPLVRRPGILDVHIRGACIGSGLELAAFAGRLTAASDAWFQLPELAMGILPGFGGCVSIPRRIGRQRAALMMLSGKRIGVRTAVDWGLVDAVVDEPPADPRGADEVG